MNLKPQDIVVALKLVTLREQPWTVRLFTQWGSDSAVTVDPVNGGTNAAHILARGDTHLPFARPLFGTPCAALMPAEERRRQSEHAAAMMGDMDSGLMGAMPSDPAVEHDHK